jgi:hypothetical protein
VVCGGDSDDDPKITTSPKYDNATSVRNLKGCICASSVGTQLVLCSLG